MAIAGAAMSVVTIVLFTLTEADPDHIRARRFLASGRLELR